MKKILKKFPHRSLVYRTGGLERERGEVLRSHQQTYDEDHLDHLGQMNPQIETHGEQWSGGDCCSIRVKIFPSNLTDSQQIN